QTRRIWTRSAAEPSHEGAIPLHVGVTRPLPSAGGIASCGTMNAGNARAIPSQVRADNVVGVGSFRPVPDNVLRERFCAEVLRRVPAFALFSGGSKRVL